MSGCPRGRTTGGRDRSRGPDTFYDALTHLDLEMSLSHNLALLSRMQGSAPGWLPPGEPREGQVGGGGVGAEAGGEEEEGERNRC